MQPFRMGHWAGAPRLFSMNGHSGRAPLVLCCNLLRWASRTCTNRPNSARLQNQAPLALDPLHELTDPPVAPGPLFLRQPPSVGTRALSVSARPLLLMNLAPSLGVPAPFRWRQGTFYSATPLLLTCQGTACQHWATYVNVPAFSLGVPCSLFQCARPLLLVH